MNQRQPPSSTSTRSHSVSGVPDCDPRNYYSYGYPGVRQRLPVPQTAPVLASPNHPILGVGFSFPTNSVNSNHRDIGIRNAFMPVAETPKPSSLPKPPVPPPTYRLYQQQMNLPGQATSGTTTRVEQQNSLYPKLSNESFNDFSLRPPRHMTSLNIVPVHPQMPGGNFCVPRGDTSPPPPPYGWATKPALHSTSVNFQLGAPNTRTPELHITTTTGNTNCTGSRLYGYNVLSPVGQTSPGSNVPYQSKVQISISPTGGCFSTGRSPLSSHSPTRFPPTSGTPTMERRSPVGVGYNGRFPSPTPSNQTSPSQINFQSPSVCQEENMYGPQSIFDQPDPEIEKLSHAPLKPLPSTHIITANIPDWNAEPGWSVCPVTAGGFAPHHELCSGEAYLQGNCDKK